MPCHPRALAVVALLALRLACSPLAAQLSTTGNQLLIQGEDGLQESFDPGDVFGRALAVGDFDGDGFADLAIGNPGEDSGGQSGAGAVQVVYGSRRGLTGTGDQVLRQGTAGMPDASEVDDHFGAAVAALDFDCDGFVDLAIGAPGENLAGGIFITHTDAGRVWLVPGSASGLDAAAAVAFDQFDWPDTSDVPESNDEFGFALAALATRVGSAPATLLVVGAPGEGVTFGSFGDQGRVFAIRNFCDGAGFVVGFTIDQETAGIAGAPEDGDRFGAALGAGDFDGDGRDDLAIGTPEEDIGEVADAGMITVIPSTSSGTYLGTQSASWDQGSSGILGSVGGGDGFGSSFAAADFDDDGFDDLAVGSPFDTEGGANRIGYVQVLYGSGSGLSDVGDQLWSRDSPGIAGGSEELGLFGWSASGGDFDGDGSDDLAIGAPGEESGAFGGAGAINALYGASGFGLDSPGNQRFNQASAGMVGGQEEQDEFGRVVAAGDFNGDGRDDLAVGVPWEAIGADACCGAVQVVYGATAGVLGEVGFTTSSVLVAAESNATVALTVRRFGPTNLAVSIGHRLGAGTTATPGADFSYAAGTLSWAAGDEADKTISVQILDDFLSEGSEFVKIELHDPSAGTGLESPSARFVQIEANDPPVFADDFELGNSSRWFATVP